MDSYGSVPPHRGPPPFDALEWARRSPRRVFLIAWGLVLLVLIVVAISGAYYTVAANEEAVILRLGKYHDLTGPGFHGKLPFGIDQVFKGEVTTVHREEFGYRTLRSGVQSSFDYRSPAVVSEATMLTGDLNLAMVTWEVRYRIRSLKDYLFEVRRPVETLRDVSQAVMRTEVGDRSVDEVLTLDRTTLESTVEEKMQAALDEFKCGLLVVRVNLKRVDPPADVKDAFNEVNRAIQERDRIVNEAEGQRNEKIPAARGEAERAIREAEGYEVGRTNRAEGDVDAFLAILQEYNKAKDVTRRRLYLEAMEELLPRVGNITIVDPDANGVLKFLDIGGSAR